jgi:hypothetical protein
MQRNSLLKATLFCRNAGWRSAWHTPTLQPSYDLVVGGGGHGLAPAYFLAKNHGARRVDEVVRSTRTLRRNFCPFEAHGMGRVFPSCQRLGAQSLSRDAVKGALCAE